MKQLSTNIKSLVKIEDNELQFILKYFKEKKYSKNEVIEPIGKVHNSIYFIESGLIRVYYYDDEAKEITLQIGIHNMWLNNFYCFFSQQSSFYHFECLESSILYELSKKDLEKLYVEVPLFETYFRLKIQEAYCRLHNRSLNLANKSAKDRYLEFQDKYGSIEQLVPQYIIASYLNISPEHLSKVRHNLTKK